MYKYTLNKSQSSFPPLLPLPPSLTWKFNARNAALSSRVNNRFPIAVKQITSPPSLPPSVPPSPPSLPTWKPNARNAALSSRTSIVDFPSVSNKLNASRISSSSSSSKPYAYDGDEKVRMRKCPLGPPSLPSLPSLPPSPPSFLQASSSCSLTLPFPPALGRRDGGLPIPAP